MDTFNRTMLLRAADWFEAHILRSMPEDLAQRRNYIQCGDEFIWGGFDYGDGEPKIWISEQAPSPVLALFHELHHYLLQKSGMGLEPFPASGGRYDIANGVFGNGIDN